MTPVRYALFWVPPAESALGRFLTAWFGWDPEAAAPVARPDIDGLPASIERLTETPARYGGHATLKAPFRLREGVSRAALAAALGDFAEDEPAVDAPPLSVSALHGFVALRPSGPSPALDAFAADCVRGFEGLRAPLTEAELERRRKTPLTPAQDENLVRWGYPYVLEEFAFHVTLTGRLSPEAAEATRAALAEPLAEICAAPLEIRDLCMMADPGGDEHFRVLKRQRLRG